MRKTISLLFACLSVAVTAQEEQKKSISAGAMWTSEVAYNIQGRTANWVNQLSLSLSVPLWKGSEWQAGLLASGNTRCSQNKTWNVAEDNQVYSNILLPENLPLTLSVCGIRQNISSNASIYAGVRNLNVDYFTTPYTSLFTNSSDGIFPTISDNFSVANYPTAAFCLHAEWEPLPQLTMKGSLYNGRSSNKWEDLFRINPGKEGMIGIAQISYAEHYQLGALIANVPDKETGKKRSNYSLFGLIEQPLVKGRRELGLLLQAGYSPKSKNETYFYCGGGMVTGNLLLDGDEAGIHIHHAQYRESKHETDIEWTYSVPINKNITLQPTFHIINTNGERKTVALLRFKIGI